MKNYGNLLLGWYEKYPVKYNTMPLSAPDIFWMLNSCGDIKVKLQIDKQNV